MTPLVSAFELELPRDYQVIGEPVDMAGVHHMLKQPGGRYQFQWWALGLVEARPYGAVGDSKQGKKGADKGVDGIITFLERGESRLVMQQIIVQVKSGHVEAGDIRELSGTVEAKQAAMGVFITLQEPSKPMLEAAHVGRYYHSAYSGQAHPKIQILTIEQLLSGQAKVDMPHTRKATFKAAPTEKEQLEIDQVGLW